MTSEIRLAFAHPSERSEALAEELRDRISLRDHIREVDIGAFQAERGTMQRICFNIVVEVRLPDAGDAGGLEDDVDRILSYDTITEAIDRGLNAERLNLLETLAERVAEDILMDRRAARVFVRIEKLDRGPGALGVEIVRDRTLVALAQPDEAEVKPLVAFLGNDIFARSDLAAVLDKLAGTGQPLILCVGLGATEAPHAAHPAAQRRIDLLAIEQNAWVLAGQDKRCVVVATRTELDWSIKNGQISVWAPSKIVLDATEGPDLSQMDAAALTDWFAEEFEARTVISLGSGSSGPGRALDVDAVLQGMAILD